MVGIAVLIALESLPGKGQMVAHSFFSVFLPLRVKGVYVQSHPALENTPLPQIDKGQF